jgi:hypothetical protein
VIFNKVSERYYNLLVVAGYPHISFIGNMKMLHHLFRLCKSLQGFLIRKD